MDKWSLTSFKISRTVSEVGLGQPELINYSGELAISFRDYPISDLSTTSVYFKAPIDYVKNQIMSYGGKLNYQITYSGYELEGAPRTPDVLLIGADLSLLFHSSLKVVSNVPLNVSAPIDPYYWVLPSGEYSQIFSLKCLFDSLRLFYILRSPN